MTITYLGTAAAEGFPGVFCNCEYCREARRLGGKNIRTRSQTLINDDLLIDLPADTYSHFLQNGIQGDQIQYLLVTHSNQDHFYPQELTMRIAGYAHNMRAERLKMYCSAGACRKMDALDQRIHIPVDYEAMSAFDTVNTGPYMVTALPARHAPGDDALIYIVQEDKTILYAHDTGYFYDEVFGFINDKGFVFDLVSMDCTNVDLTISDEGSHMGLDNIERVVRQLNSIGAVTEKSRIVINHFSHNAAPLQDLLERRVHDLGYTVAYDGCVIEL